MSRGELLAGLDDDWVYERRDEHRDRVVGVLARLAARAEGERDLQRRSITRAGKWPSIRSPKSRSGDLMRRLAAAGDRAGAIRAYERLSRRLRDELRIVPSQATRELADALRRRRARVGAST